MDLLAIRTFAIVGVMLVVTAFSTRLNKAFETAWEMWGLFIGLIALVIITPMFSFPINLGLALIFSVVMGLVIGPGIRGMMLNFVTRKRLESEGYSAERLKGMPKEEVEMLAKRIHDEFEQGGHDALATEWNNVVALAIYSTAAITIVAAVIVFAFALDFSFLGMGLLIALIALVVVGLLNAFFFRSPFMRLALAYAGAVIFSLFLLYDFGRLKEAIAAGDSSWEVAVSIGISIYLDVINLFMDLLQILSDH
ncbi:MAG: Bax inhibitor-1 family protein [Candidatus Pacebacteria bacterium]|nr:Bax inhibitor-1 family protein [Candidatus Paceibacterota bacterium]MBP9840242.1 Bax inhibitor-1 family protein [Candidatus Paceibacterota bacterium]